MYGSVAPFETVYDRLWELLIAQPSIASEVRPGNRIDYRNWNARKHEVSWADFPMLVVVDSGTEADDHINSSQASIKRTYQIGLLTGGDKIDESFYDLDWAIFRALVNFTKTYSSLLYEGIRFVGDATFPEPQDIELSQEFVDQFDGGHLSWSTTYTFDVTIVLNLALI